MSNEFEVISSEPAWMYLLQKTKISDIIPKRPLIKAQYFEEVDSLLKRMSEAHILAAVIVDSDPKVGVIGFVDVLDLMTFVVETADSTQKDVTKESFENLKWEGQCFQRQNSGSLVNISRADPLFRINSNASLFEAAKLMSKEVHRLAIVEPGTHQNMVSNVIAQSDIVNFIATRGIWIGSKLTKTLANAGLAALGVATVMEDINVVAALRYMRDFKISGVGVVDKYGRLVANFSASDLLGLTAHNFPLLALSVKEFLHRIHGYPKPPVCCIINDTVETMIYRMAIHQVHRIYIVDSFMVPTGIITMTDIMQFLITG